MKQYTYTLKYRVQYKGCEEFIATHKMVFVVRNDKELEERITAFGRQCFDEYDAAGAVLILFDDCDLTLNFDRSQAQQPKSLFNVKHNPQTLKTLAAGFLEVITDNMNGDSLALINASLAADYLSDTLGMLAQARAKEENNMVSRCVKGHWMR